MKNFETVQGKYPTLFSAPHAFAHKRPSLVGKYKEYEEYTDKIVKEICKKSQSFGIYLTDDVDYDPNYHKNGNEYKKEVEQLVNDNKIKQFIDIHGLNDEHMVDVAIYYKTRFHKSIRLAEKISKLLNNGKLRGLNIQVFRLPENGRETLTEFCASKLRIPSVQIEIARYIREDVTLRKSFVDNLSDIVK
ncbi:MAG: hypothetical protein PHP08_02235 [Candidatus Dojkabacteria bacterium]|nr:hypothetical protein [Candidatus Dojkabacteria bacterium]